MKGNLSLQLVQEVSFIDSFNFAGNLGEFFKKTSTKALSHINKNKININSVGRY